MGIGCKYNLYNHQLQGGDHDNKFGELQVNKDATILAKINSSLQLGLGYQQAIGDGQLKILSFVANVKTSFIN